MERIIYLDVLDNDLENAFNTTYQRAHNFIHYLYNCNMRVIFRTDEREIDYFDYLRIRKEQTWNTTN